MGHAMLPVYLDDEPARDDERTAPAPAQRPAPRRGLWWLAAALVVVLAGLALAQLAIDAHRRAVVADARARGAALAPLSDGLDVLWRTSDARQRSAVLGVRLDRLLVAAPVQDDGSVAVTATDPATGAQVWSTTVSPADDDRAAALAADAIASAAHCLATPDRAAVACLVDGIRWQAAADDAANDDTAAGSDGSSGRIEIAEDASVTGTVVVEPGPQGTATPIDPHLVVVAADGTLLHDIPLADDLADVTEAAMLDAGVLVLVVPGAR